MMIAFCLFNVIIYRSMMPSLLVIVLSLALQMLPSRYSPFLPRNERDERLLLLLFINFANRVPIFLTDVELLVRWCLHQNLSSAF